MTMPNRPYTFKPKNHGKDFSAGHKDDAASGRQCPPVLMLLNQKITARISAQARKTILHQDDNARPPLYF